MPKDDPIISLADLRVDYRQADLNETDMVAGPILQFRSWLEAAIAVGVKEPNAMTLSTADAGGYPSARTVLLKGLDERGFRFFTNRESRKGREIAQRPQVALCFSWLELERQVIVRGSVTELSREETAEYFYSRPYTSQIGAWASVQSQVVPGRAWLEQREAEFTARFPEGKVPLPDFWGGYVVAPEEVEFWQGRTGRLHDRLRYRGGAGEWVLERLSP